MRVLSSTLLAYQKKATLRPLVKCVLTDGVDTYTYTKTRIWDIKHEEAPWSHKLEITLDNQDKTLTDLDLKAFQAVMSWGLTTSAGDEYSACAPLTVIDQKFISSRGKLACILTCWGIPNLLAEDKASASYTPDSADTNTVKDLLSAIFGATLAPFTHCTAYTPVYDSEDSLIDSFMPKDGFRIYKGGSRLAAIRKLIDYTGCAIRWDADGQPHIFVPTTAASTTWTSPTGYVNPVVEDVDYWINPENGYDENTITYAASYAPPAGVWTPAIEYTYATVYCDRVRFFCYKYDGQLIDIDIYDADSGSWVDVYQGDYTSGAWVEKTLDKTRRVSAMRLAFQHPTEARSGYIYEVDFGVPTYDYQYSLASGYHTFYAKAYQKRLVIPNKVTVASQTGDSPSYTGNATDAASYALLPIEDFIETRLASNDQATDIAEAMILKAQLQAEGGSGSVPMNVGAEVYDYVSVVDVREDDTRNGNIGWLSRRYSVEKGEWEMRFGFGGWANYRSLLNELDIESGGSFTRLYAKDAYIERLQADQIDMTSVTQDSIGEGTTYKRVLATQISAGKIYLSDAMEFAAGYNPTTKMPGDADLDDIPDGTIYTRLRATNIQAGNIKLTSDAQYAGKFYDLHGVSIDANNGIIIYGFNTSFRTRASYNGADQCYMDSNGAICAGAGTVLLNSTGLTIVGAKLILQDANGVNSHALYINTSGQLVLSNWGTSVIGHIVPDGNGTRNLGSSSYHWANAYIDSISTSYLVALSTNMDVTATFRPSADKSYDLGTTTRLWNNIYADQIGVGAFVNKIYANYVGGTGANKVVAVEAVAYNGCPLPTVPDALALLKAVRQPQLKNGHQGVGHYFDDADLPAAFKNHTIEYDEVKAVRDRSGGILTHGPVIFEGDQIELQRTMGILLKAVMELAAKVEVLESK